MENIYPQTPTVARDRFVLAMVLFFGVPLALYSFVVILQGENSAATNFGMAAGWFVVLAFGFIEVRGLKGIAWCSMPTLITFRAVLEFVCVPVWSVVVVKEDAVDTLYAKAMFLVVLGFAAFWVGSWAMSRHSEFRFHAESRFTSDRVLLGSIAMLVIGASMKALLWKLGLSSYLSDDGLRTSALPMIQWLGSAASLLLGSLIISTIEYLGKGSTKTGIRVVFWLSLTLSLGFGIISGMKSEILAPLVCVVLAVGIARGRFPRSAVALPLLLVLIYPFVTAYRNNLNSGYRSQSSTADGLADVLKKSFADVVSTNTSAGDGPLSVGFQSTTDRLSLLNSVRGAIGLPSPSLVNGDERLWMAPFYPFVPRAIWKSKPVLNKGQRFSVALGLSRETSTAITPIADLYMIGGTFAVALGMLIYGVVLQLCMNWIGKGFSEKGLFFYLTVLLPMIDLELDVFSIITYSISAMLIALLVSKLVYGGPFLGLRSEGNAVA